MGWLKANATTVVGWCVVLLSVALTTGARLQTIESTAAAVTNNDARLHKLEADVRVVSEAMRRQDVILTRQEDTTRELEKLVVELRAVMGRSQ